MRRLANSLPFVLSATFSLAGCSDGEASRACTEAINCFAGEVCYAGFCTPDPGSEADADAPDASEDADSPDAKDRDANAPDVEDGDVEEPDAEEPDADEPDAEEPDVDDPDAEEPDADEPDADHPDTDEPVDDDLYTIEVTWENSEWSEGDPNLDVDLHYCLQGAAEFEQIIHTELCINDQNTSDTWTIAGTDVEVHQRASTFRIPGPERVEHPYIEADTITYVGVHSFNYEGIDRLTATLRVRRGDTVIYEDQREVIGYGAVWFAAHIVWSALGPPIIFEGLDCTEDCVGDGFYAMPVPLPQPEP